MSPLSGLWRRHLLSWTVPLVVIALATAGLLVYRYRLAGAVAWLEDRQAASAQDLASLVEERARTERFLAVADAGSQGIDVLYRDHFATEAARFTDAIYELRRLATTAGLSPTTMNYPRSELPSGGLVQRNFSFSVTGSYDQLRTFVNLVELSDHFLILQRISLAQSAGDSALKDPPLLISLNVATIFTVPAADGQGEG